MVVGGTAAAIRAQKMKTKPRGVVYGGTMANQVAMGDGFAQGVDKGADSLARGENGLVGAVKDSRGLMNRGTALADSANGMQAVNATNGAQSMLGSYVPGAVAAAQAQQVTDATGRQTLAAGSTGGALGLRDAMYANSAAGQQNAQAAAVQRAQEEQALLGARVAQENADRAARIDAANTVAAQRLQTQTAGAQIAQGANAQAVTGAGNIGQLGLANQGQYLGQAQTVEDRQFQANLDYEKRRQEDQQRKSQNLWNLGSSLIGGGAKAIGGAGG